MSFNGNRFTFNIQKNKYKFDLSYYRICADSNAIKFVKNYSRYRYKRLKFIKLLSLGIEMLLPVTILCRIPTMESVDGDASLVSKRIPFRSFGIKRSLPEPGQDCKETEAILLGCA